MDRSIDETGRQSVYNEQSTCDPSSSPCSVDIGLATERGSPLDTSSPTDRSRDTDRSRPIATNRSMMAKDQYVTCDIRGYVSRLVSRLSTWTKLGVQEVRNGMRRMCITDDVIDDVTQADISRKMANGARLRRAVSADCDREQHYCDLYADIFSGRRQSQIITPRKKLCFTKLEFFKASDLCPYHQPRVVNWVGKLNDQLNIVPGRGGRFLPEERSVDEVDHHDTYAEIFTRTCRSQTSAVRLMKLVMVKTDANKSTVSSGDVFVYYHAQNKDWILSTLIPTLERRLGKTVGSEDDFDFGSIVLEQVLKTIERCDYLILALSDRFVIDNTCRDFTWRAYTVKPEAVVPIALPPLPITRLNEDTLFNAVLQTNGLIYWPPESVDKQAVFWARLEQRLNAPSERYSMSAIHLTKRFCSCVCAHSRDVHNTERRTSY